MPAPPPSRPDAAGPAATELRPRLPSALVDAGWNLLRRHPAVLVPVGALHVVPLGAALAGLLLLPGRAFPVHHPSPPLALLAVLGAAALALRPLALAATGHAVSQLHAGGEARGRDCLKAAWSVAATVLAGAAAAWLVDLLTLGLARLLGRHHTLALVAVDPRFPGAAARREASRLASAFSSQHLRLNLHHGLLYLVTILDLWLGLLLLVAMLRILLGWDLVVARGFLAAANLPLQAFLLLAAWFLLEPLRAVSKALLLVDLRLREEGTDLKLRLARLG
jgi:hypothetical protein